MVQRTAYDFTNDTLVELFMDACGEAGASNSGSVIDFRAGAHLEDAHYLKGVVLSRLDGKKPPFERDDVVVIKPEIQTVRPERYWEPEIGHNRNFTVWRVHYYNEKWFLEFRGISNDRGIVLYDVEKFELVKPETLAPTLA